MLILTMLLNSHSGHPEIANSLAFVNMKNSTAKEFILELASCVISHKVVY